MSTGTGGMEAGSGSSLATSSSKKKVTGTRRSWVDKEEKCLAAALKAIVEQGWRSENGFKPNYLNKLEKAMKATFPETDLCGTPHILSKITQWKKDYGAVKDIINRSGVGFNERGDFMIECENDLWEQITQNDASLNKWRYKSWPYYDIWQVAFGNDRATGETAEDMMDAATEFNAEENDNTPNMDTFHDFDPFAEDLNEQSGEGYSTSQNGKNNASSKAKGKRRKSRGELEVVVEALDKIGDKADARLGELVAKMGFDFDVKDAKKEAFKQLDFIPGLTIRQKFYVCQILAKELDKLDVFMGLPDVERPSYVLFILEEAGKLNC